MAMFSSRNWREYPQRYRMEASRFTKSGKTYFPPRTVDPETGDTKQEMVRLPEIGKLLTYTVIRIKRLESTSHSSRRLMNLISESECIVDTILS